MSLYCKKCGKMMWSSEDVCLMCASKPKKKEVEKHGAGTDGSKDIGEIGQGRGAGGGAVIPIQGEGKRDGGDPDDKGGAGGAGRGDAKPEREGAGGCAERGAEGKPATEDKSVKKVKA